MPPLFCSFSQGDLQSVQGDRDWCSTAMLTKRYAHIVDGDRRHLADQMETAFYQAAPSSASTDGPDDVAIQQAALQYLIAHPELIAGALAKSRAHLKPGFPSDNSIIFPSTWPRSKR